METVLSLKPMIRSRLKLLIAERNVKRIAAGEPTLTLERLSAETGLAKSTLTGLTAHRARMVAFDTMDALCRFFEVQPGDLFEYVPDEPPQRP